MQAIRVSHLSYENRLIKSIMAAGLLAGLTILFSVPPANLPMPACAFHSITGHSCMTCGLTRSLHAISHGEFAASLRWHLFGPAVFVAMLLGFAAFTMEAASGRSFAIRSSRRTRNRILIALAALWFIYWSVRLYTEF
jgi:hypothetical protein